MIVLIVFVVWELVDSLLVVVADNQLADNSTVSNNHSAGNSVQYCSLYSSMMQTSKSASGSHSDNSSNHFPKNCSHNQFAGCSPVVNTSSDFVDDNFPSSLYCMAS